MEVIAGMVTDVQSQTEQDVDDATSNGDERLALANLYSLGRGGAFYNLPR